MNWQPRDGILIPQPKIPVTIQPLWKVPHLRDDIVAHHMQEWPSLDGKLDAKNWGYLGDSAISISENQIPLTLVACDVNGRYIGKGSIIPHDLEFRGYQTAGPWMGGLCVLPEFRSKGIGKKLHYERLLLAACIGIDELFLFTEQRPFPTVELYQRFGWKVECEIPNFFDGSTTERRWVMSVKPQELFIKSV